MTSSHRPLARNADGRWIPRRVTVADMMRTEIRAIELGLKPIEWRDGKITESHWFDVQRLNHQPGTDIIALDNDQTPGFDKVPPKR
jgi:hypothetical protein